jgi:hypothetical protein
MSYPRISLKHGESRVWIYADGNEIGNLSLNAAREVVDHYPYDNDLVGLVRDIYEEVGHRKP